MKLYFKIIQGHSHLKCYCEDEPYISVVVVVAVSVSTSEYDDLVSARDATKNILNYVNLQVQESENHQKLIDIQKRLDKRPIENSTHPVVAEYKVERDTWLSL